MNIFEKATRFRVRFQPISGEISVEQLWSVDTETLTNYGEKLSNIVENYTKSTRRSKRKIGVEQELNELRLAIVKHILDVRESEIDKLTSEAETKAHNKHIDALIYQKQQESLASLSIEELLKLKK